MTDLNYTRYDTPDSSLVEEVWYNDQTQTLSVSLNGQVWSYRNVPSYVFDNLVNANSVGAYYGKIVKRDFGPGDHVGGSWDIAFRDLTVPSVAQPEAPKSTAAVAKDLVYSLKAPVNVVNQTNVSTVSNTGHSTGPHLSMVASNAQPETKALLPHKVTFVIDGEQRSYRLESASVYDAKATVEELGSMLGVPVKVTKVRVYFDE